MGEWLQIKLGELAETNLASINSEFPYSIILYLDTGSITRGKIDGYQLFTLSEAPSRAKRLVKEDDIIYSTVRPIQRHYGYITSPAENLVVSTGFVVITCNQEKINPKYLYYYLSLDQIVEELDIIAEASTSAYPSLKPSDIENLELYLPKDTKEQKAIASVLSSLDDKIDLLHRQNKTLEAMAETLFRQWFVEEAQDDWEEVNLCDIADINPVYKLSKGAIAPYLEMSNVSSTTFNPLRWTTREFTSGMKFQNGDTLLARITPCLENGKTCFVTFLKENETGWGSTEYIVIRMKKPFHPFLSYIIAKDNDFRVFAIGTMTGSSGRQRAQADVFKEYKFIIPPVQVIDELNRQLAAIILKMKINSEQIRTLESLRDTLLPKLMSGEVRVEYEN